MKGVEFLNWNIIESGGWQNNFIIIILLEFPDNPIWTLDILG